MDRQLPSQIQQFITGIVNQICEFSKIVAAEMQFV